MDTAAGELALPLMGKLAHALGDSTTPHHGLGELAQMAWAWETWLCPSPEVGSPSGLD